MNARRAGRPAGRAPGTRGWRLPSSLDTGSARGSRRTPLDRLADHPWSLGVIVGSLVGAGVTVATRRLERSARRGLVDWTAAEAIAGARLGRAAGALAPNELRSTEASYAAAMAEIEPRLSAFLGTPLPGVVERASVVTRAEWVAANIVAFEALLGRLEGSLLDEVVPSNAGFMKAAMAVANRVLTTRQIAYFLAFMGTRVLGQYDLALLSAEASPGRLLFVEENIRQTARALDVPIEPFRRYIALHETTHAFEFEAHPWLRPYLAERLERQLAGFTQDAASLSREGLSRLGRSLRGDGDDTGEAAGHWMERLMTPEQRRLFRETQAVMSLLEGFSDYVMDELGREIVPGIDRISRRFHERRTRRSGMERAILRLTGMDLKMEQYRKGEQFVAAIAAAGGPPALVRLWEGPETLPRSGEIEHPERWVARVLGEGPGAGRDGAPGDTRGEA